MLNIYKEDFFSGVTDKNITEKISKMSLETFHDFYANLPDKGYDYATGLRNLDKENLIFYVNDLEKVKYLLEELKISIRIQTPLGNSVIFGKNREVTEYYLDIGFPHYAINMNRLSNLSWASSEMTKFFLEEKKLGEVKNICENIMRGFIEPNDYLEKVNYLLENNFLAIQDIQENPELARYIKHCPGLLNTLIKHGLTMDIYFVSPLVIRLAHQEATEEILILTEKFMQTEEKKKLLMENILLSLTGDSRSVPNPHKIVDFMVKNLNFDIHNYKINGKPWFFDTYLKISDLDYYIKANVNIGKTNNAGENILFYTNSLSSIRMLLNYNRELMFKKNNNDHYFIENLPEQDCKQLLRSIFEHGQKEDFQELMDDLKYNLIFPITAQGRLSHYIDYIENLSFFKEDFIQWQKQKLNSISGGESLLKKLNPRI